MSGPVVPGRPGVGVLDGEEGGVGRGDGDDGLPGVVAEGMDGERQRDGVEVRVERPLVAVADGVGRVFAGVGEDLSMRLLSLPPSICAATMPGVTRVVDSPVTLKVSVVGSAIPKNCGWR